MLHTTFLQPSPDDDKLLILTMFLLSSMQNMKLQHSVEDTESIKTIYRWAKLSSKL